MGHNNNIMVSAVILVVWLLSSTVFCQAAYDTAMESVFALQSGVTPVSGHVAARRALSSLMRRQSIPQKLQELRALGDADLCRLAQLAAVGGVSRWKRTNDELILLTENGQMIHPYSPGAVESDVMLCVICALLTVIAVHHYYQTNPAVVVVV